MLGYIDSFPFDNSISASANRPGSRAKEEAGGVPHDPADKVELGERGQDSALTDINNYVKSHRSGLLGLFGLGR